ncbi:MAG: TatD family hydrolase [bacterium]|nr:TatD family hydrolase [bacterium]
MEFIDTHAHLYSEEFDSDRFEVVQKSIDSGTTKILLPNIDSNSIVGLKVLVDKFPENCFAMLGLHPCSVQENYLSELSLIESFIADISIKAIGEIGLDLYWDTAFKSQQEDAFLIQCNWANEMKLPIAIHTRNATKETIACLNSLTRQPGGVFHCFGGTLEEANEIIAMGYHLGIGGVLTYKNSSLPSVLAQVDIDSLILETDAPYLSPVPHRGKRNESAYISIIAAKLAEIYQMPIDVIAQKTTNTASRLFNI